MCPPDILLANNWMLWKPTEFYNWSLDFSCLRLLSDNSDVALFASVYFGGYWLSPLPSRGLVDCFLVLKRCRLMLDLVSAVSPLSVFFYSSDIYGKLENPLMHSILQKINRTLVLARPYTYNNYCGMLCYDSV